MNASQLDRLFNRKRRTHAEVKADVLAAIRKKQPVHLMVLDREAGTFSIRKLKEHLATLVAEGLVEEVGVSDSKRRGATKVVYRIKEAA